MRSITILGALVLLSAGVSSQSRHTEGDRPGVRNACGNLPIYFIENRGVYADPVAYFVRGADRTLFFTGEGVTLALRDRARSWNLKLDFVGATTTGAPTGEVPRPAVISFFRGPAHESRTGLPTFSRLRYQDVWPGIDLVYAGTRRHLKYEFIVEPGSDPGRVRLRYRGARRLSLTDTGALRVETPVASFEDDAPIAYQTRHGRREPVRASFVLDEERGEYGFRLGDYDRSRPLVIDPAVLIYAGYIGGGDFDGGWGAAVDGQGNMYVVGETWSTAPSFPETVGPDLTYNTNGDAFVAKLNPAGTALLYCGYIGGSGYELAEGVAVDGAGNAYVCGYTESRQGSFPVTVGPDRTYNGPNSGGGDAWIAKVNAAGTALDYCGYIGGSQDEYAGEIAVDGAGNAYVTGYTASNQATFPVTVGPDLTFNGATSTARDCFVAKVDPTGSGFVYCGYIGGSASDEGWDIAVDAAGSAYVAGWAFSTEKTSFPVKVGPDLTQNDSGNGGDGFVAKINAAGTALDYCGYIGGAATDWAIGIGVDLAGSAYVTGSTNSTEASFPVLVGPDLTFNAGSGRDGWVAKVTPTGNGLVYCGYIGGTSADDIQAIGVDAFGRASVAGDTASTQASFPVTVGPDLTYNGGTKDAFVARVNPQGTALEYRGYIGGTGRDQAWGIATDAAGNAFVTGDTDSTQASFPVTVGPDLTYNQSTDAFVAKVATSFVFGSGTLQPGTTVSLVLEASDDVALPYQAGSSLGTGPIPIDTRQLNLTPDSLLIISVFGTWPTVFSSYSGLIRGSGRANAAINLPALPALVGQRIHTAFVTLQGSAPSGVKSISDTYSFRIQP